MPPIQRSEPRAMRVYQLVSSAQSSVERLAARMMMTPPMVGVPAFSRWLWGPYSRTT